MAKGRSLASVVGAAGGSALYDLRRLLICHANNNIKCYLHIKYHQQSHADALQEESLQRGFCAATSPSKSGWFKQDEAIEI